MKDLRKEILEGWREDYRRAEGSGWVVRVVFLGLCWALVGWLLAQAYRGNEVELTRPGQPTVVTEER